MDVSGPPPSTPPAYVEVSRYPLPLSFSCATHQSIALWFAAKKTACFFFFRLRSWTCGLVWSAAQLATTGWLLLEAELSVCFHCIVGNERWGVPWSTFWVGPLGCVRSKNCPLHTMDWQARQEPRHHSSRTLDSSRSFSFLKHNTLKS